LQKGIDLIFLSRIKRSSADSPALRLDVGYQRREFISVAATREYGEALTREFSRDRGPDLVSSTSHRGRGISHLQG